jgi:hypothetical protein
MKPHLFLCLRKENGQMQEASWETVIVSAGEHSTRNTTESPNVAVESFLSQILLVRVLKKYYLSALACLGILRRAENRGKKLPQVLQAALERQAHAMESKDQ